MKKSFPRDSKIESLELLAEGRYIRGPQYAKKYNLSNRSIAQKASRGKLIAKKGEYRNVVSNRLERGWFVLDLPPEKHPDYRPPKDRWVKHQWHTNRAGTERRRYEVSQYLENFKKNAPIDRSRFSIGELATILQTTTDKIRLWMNWGIEPWERLKALSVPDTAKPKIKKGTGLRTPEIYFQRHQVYRFLTSTQRDQGPQGTLDDALEQEDVDEVRRSQGYFVWSEGDVYPATFDGFMRWLRDCVFRQDQITKQWVPFVPMDFPQKELYRNAFRLNKDGTFQHRFIGISRPRGDFKSFDAALLFLFRFFNMRNEMILLAANSKDQTEFVLFSEASKIIQNSPKLAATPGLEIQKKDIQLKHGPGKAEVFSKIQPIATKVGTLSNVTCIAWSELYKLDPSNRTFYTELVGSIRAVPNAWVLAESTVAPKGSPFHQLYKRFIDGDPIVYFQWYEEKHYNPHMTQAELRGYQAIFTPAEYNMFFKNRWEDAKSELIPEWAKRLMSYEATGEDAKDLMDDLISLEKKISLLEGSNQNRRPLIVKNSEIQKKLGRQIDDIYTIPAEPNVLNRLRDIFGCEFIIGIGLDRASVFAVAPDRTVLATVARGVRSEDQSIYFLLDLYTPQISTDTALKEYILEIQARYGWIDHMMMEEYQAQDLCLWALGEGIETTLAKAPYSKQQEIFGLLYRAVVSRLFKAPAVPLWVDDGGNLVETLPMMGKSDILRTEIDHFVHDPVKKFFGSETKKKVRGVKDDTIYALAWAIYATHAEGVVAGNKSNSGYMPEAQVNKDVVGYYG